MAGLRGGTARSYEQDGLGSVTSLSNSTSALVDSYTYDSFGNLTASTNAFTNPFRYTARNYDSETALHYYRERYYDPSVGRFLNEDPLRFKSGQYNFFPYVNNNPVRWTDPFGLKVYRCWRVAHFNGKWAWANQIGLTHGWIKTDTKEAGLGPAGGGVPGAGQPDGIGTPAASIDHSGESLAPGASCEEIPWVDEKCVNEKLKIGQSQGRFFPLFNDCQKFVVDTLGSCDKRSSAQQVKQFLNSMHQ